MRSVHRSLWCLAVILAAGIVAEGSNKDSPATQAKQKKVEPPHAEVGPNGGVLAEWGEEKYHAEFKPDHGKKQATVWILDGDAKKYVAIDAKTITLRLTNTKPPVTITLKADPQKGEAVGNASRFVGTHEALAKEMEFEGVIDGLVAGTPYSGKFKEKEHDHKKK